MANEIRIKQKIMSAFADDVKPPETFEPVFRTRTVKENDGKKEAEVEEEKRDIFKDLPEMADEEIVAFVSKDLTGKFLNSLIFRRGIMAVIIANSLMTVMETNETFVSSQKRFIIISK